MRIFAENELSNYFEYHRQGVIQSILSTDDDYLLNVNEEDFIAYQIEKLLIEPLEILFNDIYATETEEMIPSEWFPSGYNVYQGKSYSKPVYTFHFPFTGNEELFKFKPSTWTMWSMDVKLKNNEITFNVINFNNNSDEIKRTLESNKNSIKGQLENVNSDVQGFNASLHQLVRQTFEGRKKTLLVNKDTLSSLGIPIKKRNDANSTYSVPTPKIRKKISIQKPIVLDKEFKPEPTLEYGMYSEILKIVHNTGKQFERTPSVYQGKEEEHLRDHILLNLEPSFEGSATGETFNKSGKTDILLRFEGNNVFIGECKFWHGQKGFLDTISQLIGYLTWRDSKAAVIMFVKNKDFSSVISTAKTEISSHSNFIKHINDVDETWFQYEFHINDDRNRIIHLAVMLYHLPN